MSEITKYPVSKTSANRLKLLNDELKRVQDNISLIINTILDNSPFEGRKVQVLGLKDLELEFIVEEKPLKLE